MNGLHWLGIKAHNLRDMNPAEAASVYGLARDRAKSQGDDADFFECERILALSQTGMTPPVVQQLARIAEGSLCPARNDIGLHFARATWALLLHLNRTRPRTQFLAALQAALAHDLADHDARWVGLRHGDAQLEALIADLRRGTDGATLPAILRCVRGSPRPDSTKAGLWSKLHRLLGG